MPISSDQRFDVPESALLAAAELDQVIGDVSDFRGLFWGERQVGKTWLPSLALSVHIAAPKQDPGIRGAIPAWVGNVRTDVVVVRPQSQVLDTTASVRARVSRRSALSALAVDGQGVLVLLSGHGTLPIENGRFVSSDWSQAAHPPGVIVRLDDSELLGRLEVGAVTPLVDFAVARIPGVSSFDVLVGHCRSPNSISLRTAPLGVGVTAYHHSPVRRRTIFGVITQIPIVDSSTSRLVYVDGPEGTRLAYRDLVVIRPRQASDVPFSLPGDSGSLVFDEDGRAFGTVVAGDGMELSYVLDIRQQLKESFGGSYNFF